MPVLLLSAFLFSAAILLKVQPSGLAFVSSIHESLEEFVFSFLYPVLTLELGLLFSDVHVLAFYFIFSAVCLNTCPKAHVR